MPVGSGIRFMVWLVAVGVGAALLATRPPYICAR